MMAVQVTDEAGLLRELGPEYDDGIAWLTVPPAATAVGPITFPEYLAHKLGSFVHPELAAVQSYGGQREKLPPTNIPDGSG